MVRTRGGWAGACVAIALIAAPAWSGTLQVVDVERDGVGGVTALAGAVAAAVSPDGAHLYVAASGDHAIVVFERDAESGALTLVQEVLGGAGGIPELAIPYSVVVSPDGANVYVAALGSDAILAFARDPATGQLAHLDTVEDGGVLPPFLDDVQVLAISEDGLVLYATAAGTPDALSVFTRNPTTGLLSLTQTVQEGAGGVTDFSNPAGLALHPDGYDAYVVSQHDEALLHFRVAGGGTLVVPVGTPLVVTSGLTVPQRVLASPDGRHLYLSDSGRNAVFVWSQVGGDGSLDLEQIATDGFDDFDGLAGAVGLAFHPEGTLLYATGVTEDALALLERDETSGRLRPLEVWRDEQDLERLAGPALPVVSPDGRHAYVPAFEDHALVAFAMPHLRFVEAHVDGVGGVDGLDGARAPVVTPDGRNAYVTAPAEHAVAVFARDPATGALAFVQAVRDGEGGVDGLAGAFAAAASPDGAHLYVRASEDGALAAFARDPADGTLTFVGVARDGVGGVDGLAGFGMVAASPDGAHVYATSVDESAVAIFARDPVTGALAFVEAVRDGDPGVGDLDGAAAIALDASGAHVYVTSQAGQGALTVFQRDAASGALTPVQVLREGSGGVEGLAAAGGVHVSADGRHVYTASSAFGRSGIGVFDRDSGDGTLLFLERAVLEPELGIVGGLTLRDVALSPDGTRLVASSGPVVLGFGSEGYVDLFLRDPVSGHLTRVARYAEIEDGFTGVNRPAPLTITPDGRHVLVPGSGADALAVLAVPEPDAGLAGAAAGAALACPLLLRARRRRAPGRVARASG